MKKLTVYFDGKEIGGANSVNEARKMIRKKSNFTIRKFANYSWELLPIAGREMGGEYRQFEIVATTKRA